MIIVRLCRVRRRSRLGDGYVTERYYVPLPRELGEKLEKAGVEYLVLRVLESGEIALRPLTPEVLEKK
jgi:hypothetical protein